MVAFWLELVSIKDQNCLVVPYLKYRKLNFSALFFLSPVFVVSSLVVML